MSIGCLVGMFGEGGKLQEDLVAGAKGSVVVV